jgi:hypothetical protein
MLPRSDQGCSRKHALCELRLGAKHRQEHSTRLPADRRGGTKKEGDLKDRLLHTSILKIIFFDYS